MRCVSASRIDQYIHVIEAVQNFTTRTFKISSLFHITGNPQSFSAIGLYRFNHVRRGSGMQAEDGNTRPSLRQRMCHDTTQYPTAAGDDGGAASHIEEC